MSHLNTPNLHSDKPNYSDLPSDLINWIEENAKNIAVVTDLDRHAMFAEPPKAAPVYSSYRAANQDFEPSESALVQLDHNAFVPLNYLRAVMSLDAEDIPFAAITGRSVDFFDGMNAAYKSDSLNAYCYPAVGEFGGHVRLEKNGDIEYRKPAYGQLLQQQGFCELLKPQSDWYLEEKVHHITVHHHGTDSGNAENVIRHKLSSFPEMASALEAGDLVMQVERANGFIEIGPKATCKGVSLRELAKTKAFEGKVILYGGDTPSTDGSAMQAAHDMGGFGFSSGPKCFAEFNKNGAVGACVGDSYDVANVMSAAAHFASKSVDPTSALVLPSNDLQEPDLNI